MISVSGIAPESEFFEMACPRPEIMDARGNVDCTDRRLYGRMSEKNRSMDCVVAAGVIQQNYSTCVDKLLPLTPCHFLADLHLRIRSTIHISHDKMI